MDLLIAFFGSEYVKTLLSPEMLAKYTQFITILGIVWATMVKRVNEHLKTIVINTDVHLKTIEGKFDSVTEAIEKLERTMTSGFDIGDERMSKIETRLNVIEQKQKEQVWKYN